MKFLLNHVSRETLQTFAPAGMAVASLFYAGRGVECPVCGRRYRKFLPYGYGKMRPNALCPGCMALERHRLLELYLRNRTDFYSERPLLLHVAPEACFIKRFQRYLGDRYISADLSSPLAVVKMDVQQIPFPENRFDVILCNHILEHVDDDRKAMSELYRVLKPGGWGIIQVPVDHNRTETYEDPSITTPQGRAEHFGQYDHVRMYGDDYPLRLRNAGFTVVEEDYVKTLPDDKVALYALPTDEIIYKVIKN